MSKPEPEFQFQFIPPRLSAKGREAVRPIVWAVSFLVVCYAIRLMYQLL